MKIWFGFGSEHSANLVIIGTFASSDDAAKALDLLNEATDIARADEGAGRLKAGEVSKKFSDGLLDLATTKNFASFSYGDPEELLYDFNAVRGGSKVVVTTDELDVNAFLKILIHHGAKVEVYSAHDHDSRYGRHTRG